MHQQPAKVRHPETYGGPSLNWGDRWKNRLVKRKTNVIVVVVVVVVVVVLVVVVVVQCSCNSFWSDSDTLISAL